MVGLSEQGFTCLQSRTRLHVGFDVARTTRLRTHSVPWGKGVMTGKVNNVPFNAVASDAGAKGSRMDDYIGRPISDGNMSKRTYDKTGIDLVDGMVGNPGGPTFCIYNSYPIGRYKGDYTAPEGASFPRPTDSELVTNTRARTNPSRPDYNLGSWVQNMVEFPRMVFDIGNALKFSKRKLSGSKSAANAYLAANFGWAPLFQDLADLLDVAKYVNRRNTELHDLFSGDGMSRYAGLGQYTNTVISTQYVSSGSNGTLTCRSEQIGHVSIWGHQKWQPTVLPQHYPTDSEILDLAKRTVVGATASGAFVSSWDVLPWTWLLGWFTNVRSYVLAHGNTVPAAPSGKTNLMKRYEYTRSFRELVKSDGLSGGEGVIRYTQLERDVFSKPTLSAYLPYLNGSRLSVLAALTRQRIR